MCPQISCTPVGTSLSVFLPFALLGFHRFIWQMSSCCGLCNCWGYTGEQDKYSPCCQIPYVLLGTHGIKSFSQFLKLLDFRVAILRISDSFPFFWSQPLEQLITLLSYIFLCKMSLSYIQITKLPKNNFFPSCVKYIALKWTKFSVQ